MPMTLLQRAREAVAKGFTREEFVEYVLALPHDSCGPLAWVIRSSWTRAKGESSISQVNDRIGRAV